MRAASQPPEKILLPGVGHFGQMMRALDDLGVRQTLVDRIRAGVPFLGICLGLQALFEASEEAPEARGLGIFPGAVRRFPAGVRVPHMGWNELEVSREFQAGSAASPSAPTSISPTATMSRSIRAPRPPAPTASPTPPFSKRARYSASSSTPKNPPPPGCKL